MLGMRRSIGITHEQVLAVEGALAVFERLEALGLVREQGARLVSTQRGWLLGNPRSTVRFGRWRATGKRSRVAW